MASNIQTQPIFIHSDCILHSESDDEESFVVLSQSLPPDSHISTTTEVIEPIQTEVIQESLKLTANSLSQLNNSSMTFPTMPKIGEQNMVSSSSGVEGAVNTTTTNVSVDLSPDEVQQKVDTLIEENMKLKETLHQNNLAMKKQYETLVLWQDEVMKVHQSHKEKFAETKKYIEHLKLENANLLEALQLSKSEEANLKEIIRNMKVEKYDSVKDLPDYSVLKMNSDSLKEIELNFKKQLSLQEEQLSKAHSSVQNSLMEQIEDLKKELTLEKQKHEEVLADYNKKLQESEALQKILLDEIKAKIAKPAFSPETHNKVQEQLMAAQMHITKLESLQNKDKEIINEKVEVIGKLEAQVKEMTETVETVAPLKAQLELYEADFRAEQQAKLALRAEKEQIASDLQHLQIRNQKLLEEVEQLRSGFVHIGREGQVPGSNGPSAPQDGNSRSFMCPKCSCVFKDYKVLENHVFRCIEIDNMF